MRLLDRYIAKTVLASIALVTLMLAGLQVFILFVNQLDNLGKGGYGLIEAASFVLLRMPYEVYLFFPMASLLGCLIGLGNLANHRELVVMRAAGMSIGQVTWAVLKAAMLVIVIVTTLSETLMPNLIHYANSEQLQALSGGQALATSRGVWVRHKNDFINLGVVLPPDRLEQVYQLHFDAAHHLTRARSMDKIQYINGQWMAFGIQETIIDENTTHVNHILSKAWDVPLNPRLLSASGSAPDEMTLQALHRVVVDKKKSKQLVLNDELVYWQRLIQPLTTAVMMLLAIPFIFGPLRSSTMGSKLLTGAGIGFGFHILNRFLGSVSQVYQWSPVLAAVGPTVCFALIGMYLMRRVK